jgi:hypothetical protein
MYKVAIVMPIHFYNLNEDHFQAVKHIRYWLPEYDRFIVCPRSIRNKFTLDDFQYISANEDCFGTIPRHNKFLVSRKFYEPFTSYDYILLHHFDSLVLKDELQFWCEKEYDYIGAPWFQDFGTQPKENGFVSVGNGGFSLRKIKTAIKVIEEAEKNNYETDGETKHNNNEDIFWSFKSLHFVPEFKIPSPQEALGFSLEWGPRFGYEKNDYKIPFGCHKWIEIDREFYEPYLINSF